MRHIKFFLTIAMVSLFIISCKETPKVAEAPAEEVVVEEVVAEVEEVALDSTAVEEVIEVAVDSTAVIAE